MHRRAGTLNTLRIPLRIGLVPFANMLTLGHRCGTSDPGTLALIFNIHKTFYDNKSYPSRRIDINIEVDAELPTTKQYIQSRL